MSDEILSSDELMVANTFGRINILGSSGSSKSIAGKFIAKKLGYPCVNLDEIQ